MIRFQCLKALLFLLCMLTVPSVTAQQYTFLRMIPASVDQKVEEPSSVALSSERYYIADPGSSAIYQYDTSGAPLPVIREIVVGGQAIKISKPVDIFVDRNNDLYILDEKYERVLVQRSNGETMQCGREGSHLGELDNVRSLAVDGHGFIYVLSEGTKRVEIFTPTGQYLTWIGGGRQNFHKPVALGVNDAGELYVLDKEDNMVHIFNANGIYSSSNQLNIGGMTFGDASDLAVLNNGEYVVMDAEAGTAVHFARNGRILGTVGNKGNAAKGVFEKALTIATSSQFDRDLLILDRKTKKVQHFQVPESVHTVPSEVSRLGTRPAGAHVDPFIDFVVAPDGMAYRIPADNQSLVLGYKPGAFDKPAVRIDVKEAVALTTDLNSNLFVLDADKQEVIMFDHDGVLVRRFGGEIFDKLKDAGSLASMSGGSILVVDRDNGTVKKWNNRGVFDRQVLTSVEGVLKSPYAVRTDNRNHIYIWDKKLNAIVKFDSLGKVIGKPLKLRTKDATEEDGEIAAFDMDAYGRLHLFNATTSQYEVYTWEDTPVNIFRYGRPGSGDDSFENVRSIGVDSRGFLAYIANDKGRSVKAFQLPFEDYMGNADKAFAAEQYDEALSLYLAGFKGMSEPPYVRRFVADRFSDLGIKLAGRYDLVRALTYLRQALSLYPNEEKKIAALGYGYSMFFRKLSLEENYDEILNHVEECKALPVKQLKQFVLPGLDSIAAELALSGSEKKIKVSIQLYKKLQDWDNTNKKYFFFVASANKAYYDYKKTIGVSGLELNAQLEAATIPARIAGKSFTDKDETYYPAKLLLAALLLEGKNYDDVIALCVEELQKDGQSLQQTDALRFRAILAQAYTGQGKYDAAALEYQRILTMDVKNREYKIQYAEALILNQKYQEAKSMYQDLLSEKRDDAFLIGRIGRVELFQNNYAEASFQLEKALKADPNQRELYGLLADAFFSDAKFEQALTHYKVAIQYREQQLAYIRLHSASKEESAQIQDEIVRYLSNSATIYGQLGKYNEVIKSYTKVLTFIPNDGEAWFSLGKAYLNAGLVHDAIAALTTAQRILPGSADVANALSSATSLREEISKNSSPVEIKDLIVDDLFPSLYRNYNDVNVQPIGRAIITNNTSLPITGVSMTLFVDRLMVAPSAQQISTLIGFSSTTVKLSAVFNESILENSEDANLQATVTVKYTQAGKEKEVKKNAPFILHGRNAIVWKDKRRLAAFVSTTGNEVLVSYIKNLEALFRNSMTYGLNRVILTAMQIYTGLQKSNFTYSPDPNISFARATTEADILDYLQYPGETLMRKSGDCDDLVTVYCSLLESAGIETAYIDVPGHVFMAFNAQIEPTELDAAGIEPKDIIVTYGKVWLPIETTLLGTQDFMTAWKYGAERYYKDLSERKFPELVTIADAQKVYRPSSYIPRNFTPALPPADATAALYKQEIFNLLNKSTMALQRQLEVRHVAEPANMYVMNMLGILYAKTGNFEKAESVFTDALSFAPENATFHNNIGNIRYMRGDYTKALEEYTKSLEIDDGDPEVYINICKTQIALGRRSEAQKNFDRALTLRPAIGESYGYLKESLRQ